ncbi:hypothetical protein [Microlunatus sp. GCM10028923]|uniref:hypothetical protein n=1 Tax=Microlunatus sp. GCM10028923 TaxID=3273400 RepID=UPI00361FD24D
MNLKSLSASALFLAAIGIYIQIAGGNLPGYPAVAPGVIVLLVAAALTAFLPFRWSPVAAVLAAAFMIIGLFGAGQAVRLVEVRAVGDTVGLWLQMIMVVAAGALAVLAIARPSGARTEAKPVEQ